MFSKACLYKVVYLAADAPKLTVGIYAYFTVIILCIITIVYYNLF